MEYKISLISDIKCSYEDENTKRFQFDLNIDGETVNFIWFYDSSIGSETLENKNNYLYPLDFYERIDNFLSFIIDEFNEYGIDKKYCKNLIV